MSEIKQSIVVECRITVPFYTEEPNNYCGKEYLNARKDILRYIRETLRYRLSYIPYNDELCSQKTRITVRHYIFRQI